MGLEMESAFNLVFSFGFLVFISLLTVACYFLSDYYQNPRIYIFPVAIFILSLIIIISHFYNRVNGSELATHIDQDTIDTIINGRKEIPRNVLYYWKMVWILVIPIALTFYYTHESRLKILNIVSLIFYLIFFILGLYNSFTLDTIDYFMAILFSISIVGFLEYIAFFKSN